MNHTEMRTHLVLAACVLMFSGIGMFALLAYIIWRQFSV